MRSLIALALLPLVKAVFVSLALIDRILLPAEPKYDGE